MAITLAAVPLAMTWSAYLAARTGTSAPVAAGPGAVGNSSPAGRGGKASVPRAASAQSPEEAVRSVLWESLARWMTTTPLRRSAVRIGKYRKNLDHAEIAAMANRLTDPAHRMAALAAILPKLTGSAEISQETWMGTHLTAEEREVLRAIWIPGPFY